MKKKNLRLTKFELLLWIFSIAVIIGSFLIAGRYNILSLVASLIGATALIFVARGQVIGQVLIVVFSILYGIVSFSQSYYGEMITYLGMTMPIAVISIITWVKNPHGNLKAEVKVNSLSGRETLFMFLLGAAVTTGFYFLLRYFNTSYLLLSTISVLTSFIASYLTMRRSAMYALGYAVNDIVLIVLWVLASIGDKSYICMLMCFVVFLINDIYGFFNWSRLKRRQATEDGVIKKL